MSGLRTLKPTLGYAVWFLSLGGTIFELFWSDVNVRHRERIGAVVFESGLLAYLLFAAGKLRTGMAGGDVHRDL